MDHESSISGSLWHTLPLVVTILLWSSSGIDAVTMLQVLASSSSNPTAMYKLSSILSGTNSRTTYGNCSTLVQCDLLKDQAYHWCVELLLLLYWSRATTCHSASYYHCWSMKYCSKPCSGHVRVWVVQPVTLIPANTYYWLYHLILLQ